MGAGVRRRDWELRLVAAIETEGKKPFDWGKSNCAHLMGASVRACLGDHPILADLRFKSRRGFLGLLKRRGGLDRILSAHFDEVPVLMAQRGDLGLISGDRIEAGCVLMDGAAVGKAEGQGLFWVPVRSLVKVFRV